LYGAATTQREKKRKEKNDGERGKQTKNCVSKLKTQKERHEEKECQKSV